MCLKLTKNAIKQGNNKQIASRDLITAVTHRVMSSVKLSRPWRGEKSSTVASRPWQTPWRQVTFHNVFQCENGLLFLILFVGKVVLCVYYNFYVLTLFKIIHFDGEKMQKTSFGHRTPVPTCFFHNFFVLNRNRVKRKPKFHIFCLFSNGIGIF